MNYLTTMELSQCFRVLNISPREKWDAVRKSYHLLVKQYHPDRHPNNLIYENKLKEVISAFKVLEKHYKYQESHQEKDAQVSPATRFSPSFIDAKAPSLDKSPFIESSPVRPLDGLVETRGKRNLWNKWVQKFQKNLTKYDRKIFLLDIRKNIRVHPHTAAQGGVIRMRKGKETFQITIPSGTWNRMTLRIPEKGESSLFGKKRGDLLLNIEVVNSQNINADETRFYYELHIPRENVKSSKVQTLDSVFGPIKFVLPRNIKQGQNFVLKSKPNEKSKSSSSHVVTIHFA
ncbi:MAG: DnaJ domain-containing protein [Nitrospinae bacterium]|nr:DnaJ domain-containing protein [Nitrospinota bacterium]